MRENFGFLTGSTKISSAIWSPFNKYMAYEA